VLLVVALLLAALPAGRCRASASEGARLVLSSSIGRGAGGGGGASGGDGAGDEPCVITAPDSPACQKERRERERAREAGGGVAAAQRRRAASGGGGGGGGAWRRRSAAAAEADELRASALTWAGAGLGVALVWCGVTTRARRAAAARRRGVSQRGSPCSAGGAACGTPAAAARSFSVFDMSLPLVLQKTFAVGGTPLSPDSPGGSGTTNPFAYERSR
jgi:hypothetical protein